MMYQLASYESCKWSVKGSLFNTKNVQRFRIATRSAIPGRF